MRGYWNEGRVWLVRMLSASGGATASVRAKALNEAGALAREQGEYGRAVTLHSEALSLFRDLGDQRGIAWSLTHLGYVAHWQGDSQRATPLHKEALDLFRKLGDKRGISAALNGLGQAAHALGN